MCSCEQKMANNSVCQIQTVVEGNGMNPAVRPTENHQPKTLAKDQETDQWGASRGVVTGKRLSVCTTQRD